MRVRILGAGIIGLACAEELIARGHEVSIVDPAPGRGASYAAAGMLSPGGEAWFGEERLVALGLRSLALWPSYAERLGVTLHRGDTLLVGWDVDDLAEIERRAVLVDGRPLDRVELREREPALAGPIAGGVAVPAEAAVDPRAVLDALRRRVASSYSGEPDVTVIATGSTLPEPFRELVRGVHGEILRLRTDVGLRSVVRGSVRGEHVYLVPRTGGELVVGATSEEHDGPCVVRVEGVSRLLDAARTLVPALDRAEVVELIARDRPATADNLPLVGPSGVDGIVLAAGHHRGGVLLAPLTAHLIADHLETGYVDPDLDPRRTARVAGGVA